ncbi:hypothetical protein [Lacinutrix himadriensis]|uniref:hypothetical protein n=1 Tax=Lacinutrix himadriensis TaxID=641549 RepID=UPI0006E1A380|nr:hypothetical protein [Lacinutrix himadriensis]
MSKIQLEFLRLGFSFAIFIFIITLLFMEINQVKSDWFRDFSKILSTPVFIVSFLIPIWLVIDLIRKKVADKSIFNLTFFISSISLLLLFFAIIFIK